MSESRGRGFCCEYCALRKKVKKVQYPRPLQLTESRKTWNTPLRVSYLAKQRPPYFHVCKGAGFSARCLHRGNTHAHTHTHQWRAIWEAEQCHCREKSMSVTYAKSP